MSISLRILLGFALTILLMVCLGGFALHQIGAVRDTTNNIVSHDIAAYRLTDAVTNAQDGMSSLRLAATNSFLRHPDRTITAAVADTDARMSDWERQAALTESRLTEARNAVASFAAMARDPARLRSWNAVAGTMEGAEVQLRQMRIDTEAMFAAMRAGDMAAVLAADPRLTAERAGFDRLIQQATTTLDTGVVAGQVRAQEVYQRDWMSILVALLIAVAAATVLTVLIRRTVSGPLETFSAMIDRVGAGDLSVRADDARHEIGRLGGTLNRMVENLREIAVQSRDATENLNVSVAEIRAQAQQQAAGVEQQLAAVQETAATVDEIAHSGAQISRRAQEVIVSAQATTLASASGLHAVQETGRAMEQIQVQGEAVAANIVALSEKTEAIGEIVTSVNDISERSHLLALNAAIEAASAGEHGRSFAVVAAEMKVLADQAKEATAQVRTILGDIQRGINTSVMLTEEAVKRGAAGRERTETAEATIDEMAAGIQDAVETFQQIVASTNQQQLGIEQVMAALQNIRQASQQTASGTRQLDGAALGLGDLSRRLLAVAERFRI